VPRGTASVGALNTPTGTKYIGVLSDTVFAAPFGGSLDDIRLYNRALSAAEVQRLAQGHGCVFDGSSWPAAMRELQCGLSEASPGDEIWLANGTYRAGANREMSFVLRDSVNLFGGFTANPGAPSQRTAFNPFAPSTLLLGDLNGDDTPGSFVTYGDNTRQVLVAPPGASLLLDRFGVRGGNADGRFTETVGYGGGLFVGPGANVRLNQMAFLRNQTKNTGGGVFSQSPIAISATTFISNNAQAFGGGLGVTATLQLTNSDFFSNTANSFGGGAYVLTSTVSGGTFRANRTAGGGEGGAIYAAYTLEVQGPVTFTQNSAGFGGGAIHAQGPLSVTAGTFVSNSVTTFTGGAIEAQGGLFVDSSHFRGNRATQNGGALQLSGPAAVANSEFRDNQVSGGNCSPGCSVGDGGAIFSYGPLNVTSSTFVSNTARLRGGAIAAQGPVLVTLTELDGNVAGKVNDAPNPGRGGAIFASRGLTLSMSTVATNSATVIGGGLHVSGTVLVVNTNFLSNTAQNGGGIRLDGGTAQVAGSLFAGNIVTGSGAALSVGGSNAVLVNDSFAGREANAHEAISATDSDLVVRNTLFANYAGSVLINMSSLLTYSSDLFFSTPLPNAGTDGGHNLIADPLFVDGPGGNFRLTQASSAVDAGLDAAVPSFLAVDLDGARRIADLPGVGVVVGGVTQRVDIGAYEFQPPALFLPVIIR
jgi:predicted outer membrane repeat protein